MLSLAPDYVRLEIAHDQDFNEVAEAIRTLLALCRLNRLRHALVMSEQDALDWRSSLRVGIRSIAIRSGHVDVRLACVVQHYSDGARADVLAAAQEAGLECRVFNREADALAWLSPSADAAPAQAALRR